MPGIAKLNKTIQEQNENRGRNGGGNSELILNRDGDQAIMLIAATGEDDSSDSDRIDDFYQHTYQDEESGRWVYRFCKASVDEPCEQCSHDMGAQHRFGFWAFVYRLLRKEAGQGDNWTETMVGTETLYKMDINDFKIVSLPFGRNDSIWQQLVEVYQDYNALNAVAVRVKRTGRGRETAWAITALPKTEVEADEVMEKAKTLPSIKGYYLSRENNRADDEVETVAASPLSTASVDEEIESLF